MTVTYSGSHRSEQCGQSQNLVQSSRALVCEAELTRGLKGFRQRAPVHWVPEGVSPLCTCQLQPPLPHVSSSKTQFFFPFTPTYKAAPSSWRQAVLAGSSSAWPCPHTLSPLSLLPSDSWSDCLVPLLESHVSLYGKCCFLQEGFLGHLFIPVYTCF